MFIAYEVSLELIRELRTLVPVIARQDRELAAQNRCDQRHAQPLRGPAERRW
jgi:hypothetical protein